jgi:putative transferase (TIGR04331 family)
MNYNYHLVTTADVRTWVGPNKLLFLGEWCLRYKNINAWKELNAEIASPYGISLEKKISDFQSILRIEEVLFPLISDTMNKYHRTHYSENYWRIILGSWFRTFLEVIYNRTETLKSALGKYQIRSATFIEIPSYQMVPKDYDDMVRLLKSDFYNSNLDLLIIRQLNIEKIDLHTLSLELPDNVDLDGRLNRKFVLSKKLKQLFTKLGILLARKNEPYISATLLPIKKEMYLQAVFLSFPKVWRQHLEFNSKAKPNLNLRKQLRLDSALENKLDIYIDLLFKLMPLCYLEGYKELVARTNQSILPKNPKFIFTSNDFASFEIFKCFAAHNKENGINLFIGQHGNNYGASKLISPTVEELFSNKFITWGWSNSLTKDIPGFVFRNAGRKLSYNPDGGLLLVEDMKQNRVRTFDVDYEHLKFFENQKKFIKALKPECRKSLTIRLHSYSSKSEFCDLERFLEFDDSLSIDNGRVSIDKLIKANRLTVFSYDSTGLLENLSLNIPTVAFWKDGLHYLNDRAISFYQELVEVGIVHFESESIANHINMVWEKLDYWWQSESLQKARIRFTREYARHSNKPIRELSRLIRSELP